MGIIRNIKKSLVLPELTATNKKETLTELATAVQAEYPSLTVKNVYETLLSREALGSTGLGEGIAIPHGKIRGLEEIVVCFGRSIRGIAFESLDSKPTHLFFLLLAPEDAAASYLSSLAELTRFLKNPSACGRLLQASGQEELYAILTETGE